MRGGFRPRPGFDGGRQRAETGAAGKAKLRSQRLSPPTRLRKSAKPQVPPATIHPAVITQGGLGTSSYSAVLFLRRIAIIPRKQTASTAQTNRTVAASIVPLLFRSLQATANNFEWFGVG